MLCLFGLIGAMAQTKTATGVVTDQAGEAVIGAVRDCERYHERYHYGS